MWCASACTVHVEDCPPFLVWKLRTVALVIAHNNLHWELMKLSNKYLIINICTYFVCVCPVIYGIKFRRLLFLWDGVQDSEELLSYVEPTLYHTSVHIFLGFHHTVLCPITSIRYTQSGWTKNIHGNMCSIFFPIIWVPFDTI